MKPNQEHITKLIKRCEKNDATAQMQLYKLYYKAMYNIAYRILKNQFDAEDIMQEAFLTAFTKLNTFKGEVTFGAWLKRIVINKSLTLLKKNNKYQEVSLDLVSEIQEEQQIDYDVLKPKQVLESINKLKDNYRIVLTLNLIEGYDYEEISQVLGYTNQNIRAIVSRAKSKLKTLLK